MDDHDGSERVVGGRFRVRVQTEEDAICMRSSSPSSQEISRFGLKDLLLSCSHPLPPRFQRFVFDGGQNALNHGSRVLQGRL